MIGWPQLGPCHAYKHEALGDNGQSTAIGVQDRVPLTMLEPCNYAIALPCQTPAEKLPYRH